MVVTEKHIAGPNNRWCHICGRNLGKSHARDCVYLKDTPAYHIYRASERGVLAEELTVHLPPRHLPNGEWRADYTDSQGRQNTIDLTFVEELIDGPAAVVSTGGARYSQHPFVVLPNGGVLGSTDEDFGRVRQELMADKLGEVFTPAEPNRNGGASAGEAREQMIDAFVKAGVPREHLDGPLGTAAAGLRYFDKLVPPLTKESHAQACREAMRVAEGTPVQPELFRVPPQVAKDMEQLDDIDRQLLDVAQAGDRRLLELIDQNKVPGYRRCTGYEDGNPERRDTGPLGGLAGSGLPEGVCRVDRPPADWRRPNHAYPGLPLEAEHKRGTVRIKLSSKALAYITEEIMPAEWGLDPLRKRVVVDDPKVLAEAVVRELNREDEQGRSLARSVIEQALTRVMENGEPGLDIQEVNDPYRKAEADG